MSEKEIKVEVNPQAEAFQLCFPKGWTRGVGHRIKVNDFQFSAVPHTDRVLISEIGSGAKFFEAPMPDEVEDFETTMIFLETIIGARIFMTIKKIGEERMKEEINKLKDYAVKNHGEQPPITNFDTEWLKADLSDTLH